MMEAPVRKDWPQRIEDVAGHYRSDFQLASSQFSNLQVARERAAFIRWKTIENLDKYLIEFESNFIRAGGKIIWAQDITDALVEITSILEKNSVRSVIKTKSAAVDETGITQSLKQQGIRVTESGTGDFITKEAGENPSHMVMPALHKPVDEISSLLNSIIGINTDAGPDELVLALRKHLRKEFIAADAGITGCDFLIADPGAVIIAENEGSAQLTVALPKIHIVVAGIEKLLPSINDLDLFLPLLSTYSTGREMPAFAHILSGPKQNDESDGPDEMYVILLDNGRSSVLQHEKQRQAMNCIKCGSCQFACPVYLNAGPENFPSPVSAVILPLQHETEDHYHLSYASTLCGACKNACPVNIDIPGLLLENRKLFASRGINNRSEKWFYYFWKKAMLNRDILNWKGIRAGKFIMESLYRSRKNLRNMPPAASKSFNELWREKFRG